ncbi:GDSL-type esterase/lipase family protein [Microbacterium sp. P06]|uniref:GDSL-type esterase/lipase family protein n=1 Tax=Microbacterium sp. P06 TaxID=3366949 RepID=UPI0037463F39
MTPATPLVLLHVVVVAMMIALAVGAPPATPAEPPTPAQVLRSPPGSPVTVVIGASISAGHRATPGGAWPDIVQKQLTAVGSRVRVVNASIGATRLLTSYPDLPSSLSREVTDGLAVDGVTELILADVINDVQGEPHEYDAERIASGIAEFTRVAHAAGVRVTVLTLTPYEGSENYEPAGETTRQRVNAAIRTGRLADQVVDADRTLADPAHPSRLHPDYDSGDHLHPNDAGQRALASAVAGSSTRAAGIPLAITYQHR